MYNTAMASVTLRRCLAASIAAACLCAVPAVAAPALTDGDYEVDLFQGPVLGNTRVMGLGGAYVGVAEGTVGMPFNAASVVNRPYYSRDRFDWDFAFDFLVPGIFQGDSFDYTNNGLSTPSDFYALVLGLHFQYGGFGVGLYGQMLSVDFAEQPPGTRKMAGRVGQAQLSAGYGFFHNQLIVGGGLRVGSFSIREEQASEDLFVTYSLGAELGLLWSPRALPLRVGAAASLPFTEDTSIECGQACPAGFHLPRAASMPWEVRLGASMRFLHDGPYNPEPTYLAVERAAATPAGAAARKKRAALERELPRLAWNMEPMERNYGSGFYLLVSVELVLNGPADDATDLDGFVAQELSPAGKRASYSPRLGLEAEVWPRRLRLRAGGYWEPSRAEVRAGRMHGTFSFDFRLFDFRLYGLRSMRFSSGFDLSLDYSNVAFSLGFWH